MLLVLLDGLFRDFVQLDGAKQGEIGGAHGEDDAVFNAAEVLDGFLVFLQRLFHGGVCLAEVEDHQVKIDSGVVCADGVVVVVVLVGVPRGAGMARACGDHGQEVRLFDFDGEKGHVHAVDGFADGGIGLQGDFLQIRERGGLVGGQAEFRGGGHAFSNRAVLPSLDFSGFAHGCASRQHDDRENDEEPFEIHGRLALCDANCFEV